MQQRDILKDQIEQLGRVLGKIIAEFLDLKLQGRVDLGIEQTTKKLQEELDIDIAQLLQLEETNLLNHLRERNLTAAHVEMLADYLYDLANHNLQTDVETGKKQLRKTCELLEMANELSNSLSLERIQKKAAIAQLLRES